MNIQDMLKNCFFVTTDLSYEQIAMMDDDALFLLLLLYDCDI